MTERADFALRAVHEWSRTLPRLADRPDELAVFIRLSRLAAAQDRIDDRTLKVFESHGITGSDDFRTLALLRRSPGGLTNSELIDQLGGSKAGMSARLKRLTAHGVTHRIPSQTDRRSHTNGLTTAGRALADDVVVAIVNGRKELIRGLTSDQIAVLSALLATMIDGTS